MKRSLFAGPIIIFLLLLLVGGLYTLLTIEDKQVASFGSQKIGELAVPAQRFQLKPLKHDQTSWNMANEDQYEWKISKLGVNYGTLTLNQFFLPNGDYYYFLRYISLVDHPKNLVLFLPFSVSNFEYRYITYPNGLDFQKSEWSLPIAGKPNFKFPNESIFIDDNQTGSAFLSYVSVFKPQENDVRMELYNHSQPLEIQNGKVVVRLPHHKNLASEQWGIISRENLVDWQNQANQLDLRVADLNRVRKWSVDGYYEITPSSYFPSSPTSFWRVPAHPIGEKFLRTVGSRIFADFALISLYTAIKTQSITGNWASSPRSNWLFGDYSIDASFFDTRFNTDAGLFLLKGYRKHGDSAMLDSAIRYGTFLINYADTHHFQTINRGYLIWDYGHDLMPNVPTHVSLNHLLAEMNFLYELYETTKDTRYLKIARQIRTAVNDTAPNWKKDADGDLWYAYMADGAYGLKDYPLLTLRDLRYSLQLIKKIEGETDQSISYLIDVKTIFLKKNNLPIH